MPLDTLIVKFAAPCNLACTYCYEYASGDQTWRTKPKFLSPEIAQKTGVRIREYAKEHGVESFKLVAHGGEPLLLGPQRLDCLFRTLRESAFPAKLQLSVQTNCTLMNKEFCEVFKSNGVLVGVSLDGGNEKHNELRIDHGRKPAWDKIVAGLNVLRASAPECYGGVLCVINTDHDPREVIDGLMSFDPPMIDLLQPFTSLDAAGSKRQEIATRFGAWMVAALHHWLEHYSHKATKIRYFEDALKASVTGLPTTDWFGPRTISYLVVETDGKIDLLDQLKAVGAGSAPYRSLDRSIWDTDFASAAQFAQQLIAAHSGDQLPEDCEGCRWSMVCGAGHLPSRFSAARGFNNRSTYCEGIQMVLDESKRLMAPLISDKLVTFRHKPPLAPV
jgi:uncharacterized protein